LVRRLLAEPFPRWADLTIERVATAGTDNARYRLGDDLAVRLSRIHRAVGQVELALPYYPHTNAVMVAASRHAIAEVLADRAVAD
jgi:hypothetical protein